MTDSVADVGPRQMLASSIRSIRMFGNTLRYAWFDPSKLLLRNLSATGELPLNRKSLPPLKFFLASVALAMGLQGLMFSVPPFELPLGVRVVDSIMGLLVNPLTLVAVCLLGIQVAFPWIASSLLRSPIPFKTLLQGAAYQQGAIAIPISMLLEAIIFLNVFDKGRPAWFDYGSWIILLVQFFAIAWLFRQIRGEGYSLRPMWLGQTIAVLVAVSIEFGNLAPRPSYHVPSESMLPTIRVGDVILANSWAYLWREPKPGELAIVRSSDGTHYVSRIIGLPGDSVQMVGGSLHINGISVGKARIKDLELNVDSITTCYLDVLQFHRKDGAAFCRYPRFKETLESGKSYDTLDLLVTPQDNTPNVVISSRHYFLLGDNRDNSMDSRFPAIPGQGVGLVSRSNLIGPVEGRLIPANRPTIE